MTPGGLYRSLLLRGVRGTFDFWQRLGFHVTPVHYEEAIPDTRTLPAELWHGSRDMPGVEWNGPAQLALLAELARAHGADYARLPRARTDDPHQYALQNGSFESVDGELLYALLRRLKPRRVIEVGSGNSTLLTAQALRENAAEAPGAPPPEFTAYEPWPGARLRAGVPGLTRLAPLRAQEIPPEAFAALEANDVLFIDSSHVVQVGGDVTHLFFQVLPRLAPGVVVHLHDIFLPREYPRAWVMEQHRFWTEQYLLQAFLQFNREFEVLLSAGWLCAQHPEALAAAIPSWDAGRSRPGSFWMRRVAGG